MSRACRIALTAAYGLLWAAAAQAANHVVTNEGQNFSPRNLTIKVGDTVTWTNAAGGQAHNVVADDNSFTSGSAAFGPWSYSHTFTATATVPYYCTPHGAPGGLGQSGTIVVIESLEVVHGSDLADDLNGAPDRYRIAQSPYSSYEIVVESLAGDSSPVIDRMQGTTNTVLGSGAGISTIAQAQSMRWVNPGATADVTERVRITNGNCAAAGGTCTSNDVYRLRAYETTYPVPRYNQSGSQVSVLILQNPADYTITGFVYFWSTGGTLLNGPGHAFSLPAKTALVMNVGVIPSLVGTSGTVTVAHTGRYGDLAGKIVALEPATGFSFDTLMVPRVK